MDIGGWWATVHGVPKSQTRLNIHVHARKYHIQEELNKRKINCNMNLGTGNGILEQEKILDK